MESLNDRVAALRREYASENPQQLNRRIIRTLLGEGYRFAEINNALHGTLLFTSSTISNRDYYSEDSPLYGCETNDEGYAIDPITLDIIPPELLISYTTTSVRGVRKICFNKATLYEYWPRSNSELHPVTREQIPREVLDDLEEFGKQHQYRVSINDIP